MFSSVWPQGLGKIEQNSLPLEVVLAEPTGEGDDGPPFQASQFIVCQCLPIVSSEKGHTKCPCWVQPTVLSAGLKLGKVVLPVFEGLG